MSIGEVFMKSTKNDEIISVSCINKFNSGTLMTGLPVNTDYSSKGMKALVKDLRIGKKFE